MNKVQSFLRAVKLRSIEKKFVVSTLSLAIYTIFMRYQLSGSTDATALMAMAALVWFVWAGCTIVALVVIIYQALYRAYQNRSEEGLIEKIISWVNTNDR